MRAAALLSTLLFVALPAAADDVPLVRLTFQPQTADGSLGQEQTTEGKIVNETEDGILVLLGRDGRLWPLVPQQIKEREETGEVFRPFTKDEMAAAMKAELGEGFEIVLTDHYVLCTESSRQYAQWAGMLFERLMAAFDRHWTGRPLAIHEPEFPLCAIILKDELSYKRFALEDAGPDVLEALGYYSNLSNRMVMYDLTGGRAPRDVIELNLMLAGQVANVSTIVHEATHQIAFNSGLHVRMADNPFWLVEGMAMYFEAPDLQNKAGWRTVGKLNTSRLRHYREYVKTDRKPGSLRAMLTEDQKFHAADTALDAYSEAWALTYFLVKTKRKQYLAYLAELSKKEPLEQDEPEERIATFEGAFGKIEEVEKAFSKYINSPGLK